MSGKSVSRRGWAAVICLAALFACTSAPSGTAIEPRYFQFAEIVPYRAPEPGGWRAVCIRARTGQGLPKKPYMVQTDCDFEIGMPVHTAQDGYIPMHRAQQVAADAANTAAYLVLTRSEGVT